MPTIEFTQKNACVISTTLSANLIKIFTTNGFTSSQMGWHVYFLFFSTCTSCVKYRILKTHKFQFTLIDQIKNHKTSPDCLSKNMHKLLEYWGQVIAMSNVHRRALTMLFENNFTKLLTNHPLSADKISCL